MNLSYSQMGNTNKKVNYDKLTILSTCSDLEIKTYDTDFKIKKEVTHSWLYRFVYYTKHISHQKLKNNNHLIIEKNPCEATITIVNNNFELVGKTQTFDIEQNSDVYAVEEEKIYILYNKNYKLYMVSLDDIRETVIMDDPGKMFMLNGQVYVALVTHINDKEWTYDVEYKKFERGKMIEPNFNALVPKRFTWDNSLQLLQINMKDNLDRIVNVKYTHHITDQNNFATLRYDFEVASGKYSSQNVRIKDQYYSNIPSKKIYTFVTVGYDRHTNKIIVLQLISNRNKISLQFYTENISWGLESEKMYKHVVVTYATPSSIQCSYTNIILSIYGSIKIINKHTLNIVHEILQTGKNRLVLFESTFLEHLMKLLLSHFMLSKFSSDILKLILLYFE